MSTTTPLCSLLSDEEWKKIYPRKDYESKTERSTKYPLHYLLALNQSDKAIITYIERLKTNGSPQLVAVDTQNKKWTPLSIAVMRGRENVVAALMKTKACEQLNHLDEFEWTPLHHAALVSDQIYRNLIDAGANRNAANSRRATPGDIYSLTHAPALLKASNTYFVDGDSTVPFHEIPKDQLKKLFSMEEWRDEPLFTPEFWKELWKDKSEESKMDINFRRKYQEYRKKPPKLLVMPEPDLKGCASTLGLFAGETIQPGQVIVEYTGKRKEDQGNKCTLSFVHLQDLALENSYYLNPYEAKSFGNGGRFSNFGWPCGMMMDIIDNGCLRGLLIAGEQKKKGDPIYWDYGINSTELTFGVQRILGEEKFLQFFANGFKKAYLEFLLLESNSSKQSKTEEYKLHIILTADRLKFPLSCPVALLKMHFLGLEDIKTWDLILKEPTKFELYEEWCKQNSQMSWVLRTFIKQVIEFDDFLKKHAPIKKYASEWVLESAGNLSIFQILKGMEIIRQSDPKAESWSSFKANLNKELSSYDPKADEKGPMSFERRFEDYYQFVKRSSISISTLQEIRRDLISSGTDENNESMLFTTKAIARLTGAPS